ncbi:tetratricopeptide repeat protein [Aureisphaera galaxeae]|uniref:tetratricopeptide repeat protein n=1 Tax=Aureisphaera galaxeae TaxID=1538023 RepID=UPI0023503435|nr:tetratricopeptide repeat protein [Aureisphaera galaxeae]MDC8003394.1 tetratricopeptide repeat protein [Aureisphaera galaxeae]
MRRFLSLLLIVASFSPVTAQEKIEFAKDIIQKNESSSEVAEALQTLILHYARIEQNRDSTFAYANRLKQLAVMQNDSLLFAETFLGLARGYYLDSDFDLAIDYSQKAIRVFEGYEKTDRKASAQVVIGNAHFMKVQFKESIQVLRDALPHVFSSDLIMTHISLGNAFAQLNDLDASMNYYNNAFNISNQLKDDTYLYDIYNGLSFVHTKNGDDEKAIESLKNALAEAEKQESHVGQFICYHNLGLQYDSNGEHEMAKAYLDKGLALVPKIDNLVFTGIFYSTYADILASMNNIDNAKLYLSKAERILEKANPALLSDTKYARASIAKKQGKLKEGLAILNESIAISTEHGITEILLDAHKLKSEIYEEQGNFPAALESFRKFESLEDSIAKLNRTRELEALKMQFDIAQFEQDLLVKDQRLAIMDTKQKASSYRNILFGCLAAGLLFFVYRERKISKMNKSAFQTEKELSSLKEAQIDHSKKEITEYAIHINEYNKLLDVCLSKVKTLKRSAKEDTVKSGLNELLFYIKDKSEVNKEKVALDIKVKNEQEDFTFNLKSKFPNLSHKEIQVAIYTILNMTSKQAATQMGIKEQSVYNYRLTLRKKLGLSTDTNLSEFLRQL